MTQPYPMPNFAERPKARPPVDLRKKYDHETILKGYINRKEMVELTTQDNEQHSGRVSQFDKWTITITDDAGMNPQTFFKHSLKSFKPAN